jgi:hypothetical protein
MVVAQRGTGKALISLGAIHVHSDGEPFTALTMVSTAFGGEVGAGNVS